MIHDTDLQAVVICTDVPGSAWLIGSALVGIGRWMMPLWEDVCCGLVLVMHVSSLSFGCVRLSSPIFLLCWDQLSIVLVYGTLSISSQELSLYNFK